MTLRLSEIARQVGAELHGSDREVVALKPLDDAGPEDLSFCISARYTPKLEELQAAAVLVDRVHEGVTLPQLVSNTPYLTFAKLVRLFHPEKPLVAEIHPTAVVDDSAIVGTGVRIGAYCVVGEGVRIGAGTELKPNVVIADKAVLGTDCLIHSFVSIREDSVLGHRVIVQDGARIGSDGFGFARDAEGVYTKIPQVGHVVIGDDVEIGANTCIDRATLSQTVIGEGTKLDNLVQIGHNCTIGEHVIMAGHVGLAGSVKVGDRTTLAGKVGVSDNVTIGSGVLVGGKSGVTRDVPDDEIHVGYPAMPYRSWKELQRHLMKLTD